MKRRVTCGTFLKVDIDCLICTVLHVDEAGHLFVVTHAGCLHELFAVYEVLVPPGSPHLLVNGRYITHRLLLSRDFSVLKLRVARCWTAAESHYPAACGVVPAHCEHRVSRCTTSLQYGILMQYRRLIDSCADHELARRTCMLVK